MAVTAYCDQNSYMIQPKNQILNQVWLGNPKWNQNSVDL